MKGYQRIHKFEIQDVLPYIGASNHKFCIPGMESEIDVKLNSQRMKLLKRVQNCEVCQVQASHFWLEKNGCYTPHFNLYTKNHQDQEVMLTMDHILPKSKGGATTQNNLQTLCQDCNRAKKNYLISNDDILRIRLRSGLDFMNFVIESYKKFDPNFIPVIQMLYENRKKPIIEKDLSWFTQFLNPPKISDPFALQTNIVTLQ